MAIRYTEDALIYLRQSPLCIKPTALPPAEEWMGPPPENFRNSQGIKPDANRTRQDDSSLLEQTNRRTGVERHVSRNSANPDEIILGPPRTTFSSATLSRNNTAEKPFNKDADGRFPFRPRNGDTEVDRFRGGRGGRERDGRTDFRRRGDADQDSDGWSTVKPRKSFGHEGAERFSGRMGERPDRFGGERRPRDQEERDNGDKSRRNFTEFGREKDADEGERPRRNGLNNRNRTEPLWARGESGPGDAAPPARERFDRGKSWRDRAAIDDQSGDAMVDKPREKNSERRWDRERDQRQEREPEWLDEPFGEKAQAHTQEDFQKFMESMKATKGGPKPDPAPSATIDMPSRDDLAEAERSNIKTAPALEMGQDKFFAAFSQAQTLDKLGAPAPDGPKENNSAPPSKQKSGSRFQNFFSSQEESRRQPEPLAPAPTGPPIYQEKNPLLALLGAGPGAGHGPMPGFGPGDGVGAPHADVAERVAFQALLQKLQKQSVTTPPSAGFPEPPPSHELGLPKGVMGSPGPFPPYGHERRDDPMARGLIPPNQEMHAPRPQQHSHMATMRPEQQMLPELLGQRQNAHSQGMPVPRGDQPPSRNNNNNSNAEFLMTLMQGSSRAGLEPQRHEQPTMRMPQPSRPAQIPPAPEREPDFQRDRSASQIQGGRPAGLPAFFDEPQIHREQENRPQQPTQILQRQGPPGLDQIHPNSWMQSGGGQQMPPPGRPMIPPPGLAGNPRNGPVPGMFPPNFPIGAFPPPEGMAGPPRNMAPPPGFFGGPPPPGFMGPPPGMGGFQGPEGLGFGFDGRGMPPPGAPGPYRRN